MEQKENIRIEELLPRYCDGNVTMEERHWVEQWMAESEEHQKIVRQMYLINLSADTLSVMNRVQPEKALQKVNRRIRLSEAKLWLHRLEQAAAILFLPLLGLYWFFPRTAEKEVRWLTVQTNPGMTTQLTLPDGSHVSLNSESSITYPEVFTDQTRNVKLSGEAYFEVTKNPEQRFIVSTPYQAAIEVLGTSFNEKLLPRILPLPPPWWKEPSVSNMKERKSPSNPEKRLYIIASETNMRPSRPTESRNLPGKMVN